MTDKPKSFVKQTGPSRRQVVLENITIGLFAFAFLVWLLGMLAKSVGWHA